ncbi:TIGR01619 family protein [Pasteurellaceae bacterium LIM206]|nr:TIGR01619 family protein [Pasteurellaceae bacterium LIM206]
MEIEQNWQNYRSTINNRVAIFSANLGIFDQFPMDERECYVVQFAIPFKANEIGMPVAEVYQDLFKSILRALSQLSALSNSLYAGHTICDGKAKLYFYTSDPSEFANVLIDLDYCHDLDVQGDPNWDTYFDFLLPSPLESKLNATEEILGLLNQNGKNLADVFAIEHTFYFDNKENMLEFIENIALEKIFFNAIKYTDERVTVDEDEAFYMLKLEQELSLNSMDIFNLVEKFDQLANQYSGEYVGWECDGMAREKDQLN